MTGSHRGRSASLALLIGLLCAALVLGPRPVAAATADSAPPPSSAGAAAPDDPVTVLNPPPLEVSTVEGSTIVLTGTELQLNPDGVAILNPDGDLLPASGCSPVTGVPTYPNATQVCIGADSQVVYLNGDQPAQPATIETIGLYEVKRPNIAWIEQEAVTTIMALHGLTRPDIVRSYHRPEIRAYVENRIVSLLDKRLYGVPMTAQETQTYTALMTFLQQRELQRAKFALAEYERWQKDPCGYQPPQPPDPALPAYPNSAATQASCRNQLAAVWDFTKNTPPVAAFQAWGAYRHPSPLSAHLSSAAYKQMRVDEVVAIVGGAGIGAGIAIGAVTTTLLGLSQSAGIAVAAALQASYSALTSAAVPGAAVAGIGAAAAGAVIGAVVAFLVLAAVSIWAIVQEEQIPAELRRHVDAAAANTDPLGIDALAPAYAGLDIATREQPPGSTTPPLHQGKPFFDTVQGLVSEWMVISVAGDFLPDPDAGYDDVPFTNHDARFRDLDAAPGSNVRLEALVATDDQTAAGRQVASYRVYFSDGNMMVQPRYADGGVGPAEPRITVRYLDHAGDPVLMSVVMAKGSAPGSVRRKFALSHVTEADGTAAEFSSVTDTWSFRDATGVNRSYGLVDSPPLRPDIAVVPSVLGTLLPGHSVRFQAHVNREPDPDLVGVHSWTIQRLGPDGSVVETETRTEAQDLTDFVKTFAVPGPYRVTTRYRGSELGIPFDVSGTVTFTIAVPRPELATAELVDDRVHGDKLFLDLRMVQQSPTDTYDVAVEWADDNRGNRTVTHYTVRCRSLAPEPACDTDTLVGDDDPINDNWSASPTFRLPDDLAYLPFVTVTITNSYGATVERAFRIDGEHRARYADRAPYVEMPVGVETRVPVTTVKPSTLIPGASISIEPYVEEITEQLPPGVFPDLEVVDGEYVLQLRGSPESSDIGVYTFSMPVQHTLPPDPDLPPTGSADPAPVQVTLDIKPSVQPGFRAILSDVPEEPLVARTGFPQWGVHVVYHTPPGADPADDPDFQGHALCRLTSSGTQLFEKPCALDEVFPWPADQPDGDYTASVVAVGAGGEVIDGTAYTKSFSTRVLRPTLTRDGPAAPDAPTEVVRLSVEDFFDNPSGVVAPPFDQAGYTVECRIDGAATFAPCLNGGAVAVRRSPGPHSVEARVTAPDGTQATRSVTWTVGTPPATLRVQPVAGLRHVGKEVPLSFAGLLPTEAYRVTIGGREVAVGTVPDDGTVERSVVVPDLPDGPAALVVTGFTSDRVGTVPVAVVGPARLETRVRDERVEAGGRQRLVVRGLQPGEAVRVRYRGDRLSPRTAVANSRGVYVLVFDVGRQPGRFAVRVVGAFNDRSDRVRFSVT